MKPKCRLFARSQPLLLTAWILVGALGGAGQPEVDHAIGLAVAAQYEEALQIFKIEQMRDPDNPLLGYYVGMTEFKLEHFSRAIANFEESIDKGAEFPQVFHWLAQAYLRKHMPERAAGVLQKGLTRFPLNDDLRALAAELEIDAPG